MRANPTLLSNGCLSRATEDPEYGASFSLQAALCICRRSLIVFVDIHVARRGVAPLANMHFKTSFCRHYEIEDLVSLDFVSWLSCSLCRCCTATHTQARQQSET
jgi:hypothetical protein